VLSPLGDNIVLGYLDYFIQHPRFQDTSHIAAFRDLNLVPKTICRVVVQKGHNIDARIAVVYPYFVGPAFKRHGFFAE
jgi:hypothetical protein